MEATVNAANTVSDENQAMILRNNAKYLADLVAADQNESGGWFITSWSNYYAQLGQASAIRILQLANEMSFKADYWQAIESGANALLTQQNTDGSFKYGPNTDGKNIQTTAYAVIALEMAGSGEAAEKAAQYLASQQLSNGGWIHSEEGTEDEYPEINSEALRAIIVGSWE